MDDEMPRRQGRGARQNVPNQYERLHIEVDPGALDENERRSIETTYLRDPAESILSKNESPDVPFTYSLNPYRGCEHGCVYCLSGDTSILMADGTTKPLETLSIGDAIYGTERHGSRRRHVKTQVLDHWRTIKPGYRITLENGTQLVASGNHRFLTKRGWKYVTNNEHGSEQRPHLTTSSKLIGACAQASQPREVREYRRVYARGIIPANEPCAFRKYERDGCILHTADPTIRRNRGFEGQALKSSGCLQIVEIEPIAGPMPLYDITTGTGDFIANGVVSHNCYARPSHEYWGLSAGLDFESKIFVKEEAPKLLSERLQKESWTPQGVALSGNTDPYQPVERELEITRSCLEVFLRHRNPVSIVTKSGLIQRDTDLLEEMAQLNLVNVAISLTSVDDTLAGKLEPRAARPSLRLRVVEELTDAGVPVSILVAPLIPGLNDEQIPKILEAAAQRGAQCASYVLLRLPGAVKDIFIDWIEDHFPERKSRILGRLRQLREGELNETRFGRRMRGEGEWAQVFRQLFRQARVENGLDRGRPELSTQHFRRLPGGQRSLFDE